MSYLHPPLVMLLDHLAECTDALPELRPAGGMSVWAWALLMHFSRTMVP